jgi:hypothetical protein
MVMIHVFEAWSWRHGEVHICKQILHLDLQFESQAVIRLKMHRCVTKRIWLNSWSVIGQLKLR